MTARLLGCSARGVHCDPLGDIRNQNEAKLFFQAFYIYQRHSSPPFDSMLSEVFCAIPASSAIADCMQGDGARIHQMGSAYFCVEEADKIPPPARSVKCDWKVVVENKFVLMLTQGGRGRPVPNLSRRRPSISHARLVRPDGRTIGPHVFCVIVVSDKYASVNSS